MTGTEERMRQAMKNVRGLVNPGQVRQIVEMGCEVVTTAELAALIAEIAMLRAKLERIRLTVFDERATVYSDAPGYIQDIRDILEDEATNG